MSAGDDDAKVAPAAGSTERAAATTSSREIAVPISPAEALERVVVAFASEGVRLESVDRGAGTIRTSGILGDTVPITPGYTISRQVERFINVSVTAVDSGARIKFSITERKHVLLRDGRRTSPETTLEGCDQVAAYAIPAAVEECRSATGRLVRLLDGVTTAVSQVK